MEEIIIIITIALTILFMFIPQNDIDPESSYPIH